MECSNGMHEGCGGCDYPPECAVCEACSREICTCPSAEHVTDGVSVITGVATTDGHTLCVLCAGAL